MKRYQITLGDGEAERIDELATKRGIPPSRVVRELAMSKLLEEERLWNTGRFKPEML